MGITFGESVLSLNVVLLLPIGLYWLLRKFRISKTTLFSSAAFILFLLLSFGVAQIGPCEDKFSKALISAPLLTMLLIISLEIGVRAKPEEWQKLRPTAFRIIVVAFIFIIAEILFPQYFSINKLKYHPEFKYSGLFYEPSHVAISLFPCIAILLSSREKSYSRKGLYALLLLFVVSRSSTLFMLTLCYISYRLLILKKLKQGAKYLMLIGFVITIALTANYELLIAPTVERFVGVTSVLDEDSNFGGTTSKKDNLSSLIYLKGWQDALANTARTYGLGLGFNMMGCSPLPDVPIRTLLSVPGRMDLNNEDGSFLLSKLMSEFGVLGLAFFIWAIVYWIRYELKSRAWSAYAHGDVSAIHTALMFSFVATSLLRSSGYFQGGALLWASAMIASVSMFRKIDKAKKSPMLN